MKIIVVKDRKSGDSYYNASTFEKLAENSLKILKNFQNMGYFETREEPKWETIPDEVLKTLPESIQEKYRTDLYWYEQSFTAYQSEKKFNDTILSFLNGDVSIYTPFTKVVFKASVPLIWEYLRDMEGVHLEIIDD
jgi:hypothetical protein